MRLIDADAYSAEMKERQDSCEKWMHDAERWDDAEQIRSSSSAFSVFVEAKLTLDKMPTIDAVPKWIPCSERLPESYGKYIVTRSNSICGLYVQLLCYADSDFDFGGEARYENDNPCWYYYDSVCGDVHVDDVIAWMPLPEPYKTDGKEKDDGSIQTV